MKTLLAFLIPTLLIPACNSEKHEQRIDQENQTSTQQPVQMNELQSLEEWIRPIPIKSVAEFDENRDGHVYNDNMCWNVIADVPGKCPKCGMKMKKVTISDAESKLKKHGMM